jgi:hypothetical protein
VSNTFASQPTVSAASTAPFVPRAHDDSDWPHEMTQMLLSGSMAGEPSGTGAS